MDEILQFFKENGFEPTEIILDSKIHRFGKNKNHWYIGFQNFSQKTGEPFYVAQVGSWKSGETYQYQTKRQYSKEEKEAIKKKIQEQSRKIRAEKKARQEDVSNESKTRWENANTSGKSEYLDHKKVKAWGIRFEFTSKGRAILVPCRDIEHKLWGIQSVYPDGSKYFTSGQKIKGCFHLIGEIDPSGTIYICEGYATGASIYEALKMPVIVGFNASNLVEISKILPKKYPKASFVICADDDRETEGNPGLTKAEEAAQICLGSVVSPIGISGTDFNDVHCELGLDHVREQILRVEIKKNYILKLGHKGDLYYYTSSSNNQITAVGYHTKNQLLNMMPLGYWENQFPSKNGFDLDKAVDDLMVGCREAGIFDENCIRGTGVWEDNGKYIVNTGRSLFYDNKKHGIHDIKSRFVYEIGRSFPTPDNEIMQVDEAKQLFDALNSMSWVNKSQVKFLLGWIVLAPICGALKWRPHLWVTGPVGSGKSTLLESLINIILSDFSHYFQGSQTTEPGIRQTIGCSSRAIIFDEFETDGEKSSEQVQNILELFRQASSESKGAIVKGTATGQAIQYRPRFCCLVSSVRVNLMTEADRSRFTTCELTRGTSREQYDDIKKLFAKIDQNFGKRLYNRTYAMLPILKHNIEMLWNVITDHHSPRFAQQYGALLGGCSLVMFDKPLDMPTARKIVDSIDFTDPRQEAEDTDETECIDHLMRYVIRVDLTDQTIAALIRDCMSGISSSSSRDALKKYGILVEPDFLYVAKKNPMLERIFKRTKWIGGWAKSLTRLSGSEARAQKKLDGKNTKCVKIPLSSIFA